MELRKFSSDIDFWQHSKEVVSIGNQGGVTQNNRG